MKTLTNTLALLGLLAGLGTLLSDEARKAPEPGTVVVTDNGGKEHKIKGYRFTLGTMRLGWLAPPTRDDTPKEKEKNADDDEDAKPRRPAKAVPAGPEALVIRDDMKITFLAGVQTLVPAERLRSVTFDNEKQTLTVKVATTGKSEDDVTLVGTTLYKGINKITLEAEVDKGEAGVASVTFQGGTIKGGIKGIRFPDPKVEPVKQGRPAVVTTADKDTKRTHKVSDLQALYQLQSGKQKLLPLLHFKRTLKIDMAKIQKITASADSDDVWQVTQKDDDSSLTLLTDGFTIDGEKATLLGLLGKVPAGYKLIPPRRVSSVVFDTSEEPKEKDKGKKKDTDDL